MISTSAEIRNIRGSEGKKTETVAWRRVGQLAKSLKLSLDTTATGAGAGRTESVTAGDRDGDGVTAAGASDGAILMVRIRYEFYASHRAPN